MTTSKPPGCFGFATVYNPTSVICKGCNHNTECGKIAYDRLQSLKDKVDVSHYIAAHEVEMKLRKETSSIKRCSAPVSVAAGTPKPFATATIPAVTFPKSSDEASKISSMSKNAAKLATRLIKDNRIAALNKAMIERDLKHAATLQEFMRVVADMLIGGGFTKQSLRARFIEQLDWTDGTASSHVAIVISFLENMGFDWLKVTEGKYELG